MGLRFRKTVSLGKFFRLTASKSGLSFGIGPRGLNINLSSRGTKTTIGVPGTGVFWQQSHGWRSQTQPTSPPVANPDSDSSSPPATARTAKLIWTVVGVIAFIALVVTLQSAMEPPRVIPTAPRSDPSPIPPAVILPQTPLAPLTLPLAPTASPASPKATMPAAPVAAPPEPPPALAPEQPVLPILSRDEIVEMQRRLRTLGHDPGPVDGVMGPKTHGALRAYQASRGLDPNGQPTAETLARLLAEPTRRQ